MLRDVIESFCFGNFPEAKYTSSNEEEIHFNTPFAVGDNKKRLYVSADTGRWFDQKNQRGGNKFVYFVSEYKDITVGEAYRLLKDEYSDGREFEDYREEEKKSSTLVEVEEIEVPPQVVFFDEAENLGMFGVQAKNYLEGRKLNTSGLGYFSTTDYPYAKRVFVPFYENGKLVYYIARSFDPNEKMRFMNPKNENAGDWVYNLDNLQSDVFLFEGTFDAMSLDYPQVGTSMLSSVLKDGQAKKIINTNPQRIILVPDNDKEVSTKIKVLTSLIKTYEKLMNAKKYKQNFEVLIYRIPEPYKDFNEYKIKTGNGIIFLEDCKPFKKEDIMGEIVMLGLSVI